LDHADFLSSPGQDETASIDHLEDRGLHELFLNRLDGGDLHWHELSDLVLEAHPLNGLLDDLKREEGNLLVVGMHHRLRHLFNHVLVAKPFAIHNHVALSQVVHCLSQSVVDLVNVRTQLLELNAKGFLVVRDVQEGTSGGIDKAILLTDCEHVFFEAQVFKFLKADALYFQSFDALYIHMHLSVFIEQVANLLQLLTRITTLLITEEFVESANLAEG